MVSMEASALHAPVRRPCSLLLRLRSDDQLVALFRAGDDDAFAVIHDRYRQRVLAYTRRMIPGEAEDVTQDVFLRAYRALRTDERQISLRAWLYRIAHNRCIDELRRPAPAPAEQIEVATSERDDPVVQAGRRESFRRLVDDLGRLPDQQRSALLMRELEGLSYADIALSLGVTLPAIKSLLVRARMSLAEAGEARSAACVDIRADLARSCDRGVRMSGRARRHLHDCTGCRAYRHALRTGARGLGALEPGMGPIAALGKLLGLGGSGAAFGGGAVSGGALSGGAVAGGGVAAATATKVAIAVCCVAVTAGGATRLEARHQAGGRSPATPAAAAPADRITAAATASAEPLVASGDRGHAVAHKPASASPADPPAPAPAPITGPGDTRGRRRGSPARGSERHRRRHRTRRTGGRRAARHRARGRATRRDAADRVAGRRHDAGERARRREARRRPRRHSGGRRHLVLNDLAATSRDTGSTRTGMPLRNAMPASGSRSSGAELASRLTFTPPAALAVRHPPPRWPQPCGTATVPTIISSVTRTASSMSPDFDASLATPPSSRPKRSASSGCTRSGWSRPPRISSGELCIQELCERSSRRPIRRSGKAASRSSSACSRRAISATIAGGSSRTLPLSCRIRSPSTPVGIAVVHDDAVRAATQLLRGSARRGAGRSRSPSRPVRSSRSIIRCGRHPVPQARQPAQRRQRVRMHADLA